MSTYMLCAFLAAAAQNTPAKNGDVGPLTIADALYTIADVSGAVQGTRDLDGDGVPDIVAERGGSRVRPEQPSRLELVSTRTGKRIRVLWSFSRGENWWMQQSARRRQRWDFGGDVNGDGTPDAIVGLWRNSDEGFRSGAVSVISGADGSQVVRVCGETELDGFGFSVAFVGDVDRDGVDDFAVGAPQAKLELAVIDMERVKTEELINDSWTGSTLYLKNGRRVALKRYAQERLDARSAAPGYVSIRSGKDGAEIHRFIGSRSGHGFGSRVVALQDLDADGCSELGVGPSNESMTDIQVLSLATGERLYRLENLGGRFGGIGDVSGDGIPDLYQALLGRMRSRNSGSIRIVSGEDGIEKWTLRTPDGNSKYTQIARVGDVDGDGTDDIAIGEGNFHLPGPGRPLGAPPSVDLSRISLRELTKETSMPQVSMSWESGCAWVYSGAKQEVILGVYGLPGTGNGVGLEVSRISDANGDGVPDVIVATENSALVFAGPGSTPRAKKKE